MTESERFRLVLKSLLAAAAIVVLLLLAAKILPLLVLAFGSVILGLLIHSLAELIRRHTPMSAGLALAATLLLLALTAIGTAWMFGAQIRGQFGSFAERIPLAWEQAKEFLREIPGGDALLSSLQGMSPGGDVLSRIGGLVRSLVSMVSDLVLLLLGAVFIASNPGLYRRGLVKLIPKSHRDEVDGALGDSGRAVRRWMLGQLVAMCIVGLLTWLGLWLVGVPSALALGIIAGLAEIIPWAGPIIAAVPALLIALTVGPETALLALVVLLVVQQIEGTVVMPLVQKKAVHLPPALTVFGVVAMGLLFGPVGLIFAAPLLVVLYVLVKRLYVREMLQTPTSVPGAD